jgi:hypothetical protein
VRRRMRAISTVTSIRGLTSPRMEAMPAVMVDLSTTPGIMKVPQAELTTLMAIVIQVVILEVTVGVTQAVIVTVEVEEADVEIWK